MPAKLTTQLVDELPVIALVGEDSSLVSKIANLCSEAGFSVRTFTNLTLLKKEEFEDTQWYKIIWVTTPSSWFDKSYLFACSVFAKIKKPVVVVMPVTTTIAETTQPAFAPWYRFSRTQEQVFVDCNYYLPLASFIFAQDLLEDPEITNPSTALGFVIQNIKQHIVLSLKGKIYPQTEDEFVSFLPRFLFNSRKTPLTVVRGKELEISELVRKISSRFESYYSIKLEKITGAQGEPPILSSVKIQATNSDFDPEDYIKTLPVVLNPEKAANHTLGDFNHLPTPTQAVSKLPGEIKNEKEGELKKPNQVKQELQRIFDSGRIERKNAHVDNLVTIYKKSEKKTKRKKSFFYLGVGVIALGVIILFLTGIFLSSVFFLQRELQALVKNTTTPDVTQEKKLLNLVAILHPQVKGYATVFSLPQLTKAEQLIELAEKTVVLSGNDREISKNQEEFFRVVTGNSNKSIEELSQTLTNLSQESFETISHIQNLIKTSDLFLEEAELSTFRKKIEQSREKLLVSQQFFSLTPTLFPEGKTKTYAVLFQNDQELRPTGGFIQSVGFITISNGEIVATSAESSYDLDSKTFASVTPPPELSQYLGEKRWYLRDSNWNPSFPTTAQQTQWFIEQATGKSLSGVIALNTFSLSKIIEAIGPIDLPEFNEVITAKNLQERMEFHSEVVLVESSNLPDYSSLLLQRVLEKLITTKPEGVSKLGAAFFSTLQEQQTLLYSADVTTQSSWHSLGWTGEIASPQCPTQLFTKHCLVESFYQVETNVGINKANYYLEKNITHEVDLAEEKIQHKRVIKYVNTAQTNAWPKGSYKSFVRFVLPNNSQDLAMSISGSPIPQEELHISRQGDRAIVGAYLEVPIQQSRELVITFTTKKKSATSYSYAFFDQKQPGTNNTPFVLKVTNKNHPPLLIAPQADFFEDSVVFSQQQNSHLFFGVAY